jgi:hypothetical protein
MPTATRDHDLRSAAIRQLRARLLEEDVVRGYAIGTVKVGLAVVAVIAALGLLGGLSAWFGGASSGARVIGAFTALGSVVAIVGTLAISEAITIGAAILRELQVSRLLLARLVNGRPQYPAVEDWLEEQQVESEADLR